MDHTHIVQAADLGRYADARESQSIIPELVYLLVKQSVSQLSVCRIPYGDVVNQSGWDGLVKTEEAFLEFVPKGNSYWEIGTGKLPQKKATDEFTKRKEKISDVDRNISTFVFVTPRSSEAGGWTEPKQTKWLEDRKDSGWGEIRIIDGVKLADWLREFPALGRWLAKKIGLTASMGGLSTPAEHWETIQAQRGTSDPLIPSKIFLEGRQNACTALQELFEGRANRLLLYAESEKDVDDFVSAYLASDNTEFAGSYRNRCLFINDEDAWRSVAATRRSHVLVADPRLSLDSENADLQTVATRSCLKSLL